MIDPTRATPREIQVAGIDALTRELGPIGMIRFLQIYDRGHGDYSVDRHQWLDTVFPANSMLNQGENSSEQGS